MTGVPEGSAVEMMEAGETGCGHAMKCLNALRFTQGNMGTWKDFRKVIQLIEWKMDGSRREQEKKWERNPIITVLVPEE